MPSRFVTNNHSVCYGTQRQNGTKLRAGYPQWIALALQFDDYSDNLLESSLYDYVYSMGASLPMLYGYDLWRQCLLLHAYYSMPMTLCLWPYAYDPMPLAIPMAMPMPILYACVDNKQRLQKLGIKRPQMAYLYSP